MSTNRHHLNRRDFLKVAAVGVGGAILAGCRRNAGRITPAGATPTPDLPEVAAGVIPDIILIGGKVITMDAADTITQAVAVYGNQILRTGTDAEVQALAGPNTQTIQLNGRTVTPGLVDAHNHISPLGLIGTAYIDINPPAVSTVEEMQARIAEGCAEKGPGKWVIAQGFISFDGQYPDKTMLDPVSPDNPVMLINQGGHMGTVNSLALALAGIDASTPDPQFGTIVRDDDGEPTGLLVNHAAMDIVRILWYDEVLSLELRRQSIIQPLGMFASYGVTSFGDVNVRGLDSVQMYLDVARSREMAIRGHILNTIEYYGELDGREEDIQAILYEDEFLHFGGYKFLLDGALAAAYMHEPTNGIVWNLSTWRQNDLKDAVSQVHDMGYQCSFHVIGDAAVDMALDAIEYAMNRNPRSDPRHRLEHVVLSSDSALQRMRDLGVIVSTQPHGIYAFGDTLISMWGEERALRIMPTRTWLDLGVPLSISSDAPTLPWYLPPPIIAGTVNRLSLSGRVFDPDQCLTVREALRAYTMGGAYAMFEDNVKGSLEPGKYADLVIWRLDPLVATLQEMMAEHPVDLTMIGGQVVFERN